MAKKSKVAEDSSAQITEPHATILVQKAQIASNWNFSKLQRAGRMLKKGFSCEQIGRELHLNAAEVAQLEIDAEDEQPELESFEGWRKRMKEQIERRVVTISDRHLENVQKMTQEGDGLIDPELMATVKDASAISYLWLRKGEEQSRPRMTVDFTVLANAQRATLGTGTGSVVEIESERTD